MTFFLSEISASKKTKQEVKDLDKVFYVYYLILFPKNMGNTEILISINSKNKINAINPAYAAKLGLQVQKTDISI